MNIRPILWSCLSVVWLSGSLPVTVEPPSVTAGVADQTFAQPLTPVMEPKVPVIPLETLTQQAEAITVKVFSGEAPSSGILVQRQGPTYTVLTNQHALREGDTYRIQTPDNRVYPAVQDVSVQFATNDLAILTFHSRDRSYAIATFGSAFSLPVGEPIFAAGFPVEEVSVDARGFKLTSGHVAFVSKKALDGGYQLGYTNDIRKGMSGGPVLNHQGKVVGVNGMHPQPLWGDPYVFQDGSKPCSPLHKLMVDSSWAIPIETVVKLAPRFRFETSYPVPIASFSSPPAVELELVFTSYTSLLLQQRAEEAAHCRSVSHQ